MCVICYKPKNKALPSDEKIKNMFNINSDGAGYMFVADDKVVIKKGYMNADEFIKALKKDYKDYKLKKHNVVLHFRIGTSGGITPSKCHPFPLSKNEKDLNKTYLKSNVGVCHNGVLSDYVYGKLSDTQNYIKDFLKDVLKSNLKEEVKSKVILDSLNTDKLIVLDKNDDIKMWGEWCTDEKGLMYSNLTYKTNYYTSSTKEYTYNNYNRRYDKPKTTYLSDYDDAKFLDYEPKDSKSIKEKKEYLKYYLYDDELATMSDEDIEQYYDVYYGWYGV